jgi:potassium channel subfamily K
MSLRFLIPIVWLRRRRDEVDTHDPEKVTSGIQPDSSLGLPRTYTTNTMNRALPNITDDEPEHATPKLHFRYAPLLAGVLIPFSILLEIPGVTERWCVRHPRYYMKLSTEFPARYVKTYGDNVIGTRPNPLILDIGLGFSMASAILANVALIARFLNWRIRLTTLVCIVLLSFHGMAG